jgi:hypothetical protein
MGRPLIDPKLMIRMLIIGYCVGIRSERRLCDEVHLNLAYRWFCRLELEADVPDHLTFSRNHHGRFRDSDLLRKLLETTVERCMAEGLVGGEGFAVDASLIRADANRQTDGPGIHVVLREFDVLAIVIHLPVLMLAEASERFVGAAVQLLRDRDIRFAVSVGRGESDGAGFGRSGVPAASRKRTCRARSRLTRSP